MTFLFLNDIIATETIVDAEIGVDGDIRAKGSLRDLGEIKLRSVAEKVKTKLRKKRSPGFKKRFKKAVKKTWVSKLN